MSDVDRTRVNRWTNHIGFEVTSKPSVETLNVSDLISEAKKKLAGNLCVNTGQGSGGGFTACNVADAKPLTDEQRRRFATYRDENGKAFDLSNANDVALIRGAVVPPAYTDVTVYRDPNSSVVYRGTNDKGKQQARYSVAHTAEAAAEKFTRIKEFSADLPALRRDIMANIDSTDVAKRDAARVLHLIDTTFIRIGSGRDTKAEVQAYGASTLQSRHVKFSGVEASLVFTGKKGVKQNIKVSDPTLVRILKEASSGKGPKDRLFNNIDENDVRRFMKEASGKDYTPKDFRSYHGSRIAFELIQGLPKPRDAKSANAKASIVKEKVADALGNTPAVSFRSYINPIVWDRFKQWGFQVKGLDKIPGAAA